MFLSVTLAAATFAPAQPAAPFEIKDGDRIVWVGGTLVEREQRYGYWETALYAAFPKVNFTVRNLGWSGDTVWGESRGRFDFANPDKCFRNLVDQTLELKPTVIFVSYGTVESFEGESGLPRFEQGLNKLLDALKSANARVVLFSPPQFEKCATLPDPLLRNRDLGRYRDLIKRTADARMYYFADMYNLLTQNQIIEWDGDSGVEVRDNGMHLSEAGYRVTFSGFLHTLGHPDFSRVRIRPLEPVRLAVVEKNQLFFHRWRPQNETYLFGFRKHEQGRNAREVAEFDPLVAKAEDNITALRKALTK